MSKPNYYAVIPATVRYDKRLKPIERLLFGEITCLANKDGFCFASSAYFAGLYGTTRETVSRYIKNLAKCGYINLVIDNGCQRRIYLAEGVMELSQGVTELSQGVTESSQGCDQTVTGGCDRIVTHNNTSTNTLNYKEEASVEKLPDKKVFTDEWNKLPVPKITGIRGKRLEALHARVAEYSVDDVLKAIKTIQRCPFLLGNNQRNWRITFDWFLKPNNFPKVLEGNYLNESTAQTAHEMTIAEAGQKMQENLEKSKAGGQRRRLKDIIRESNEGEKQDGSNT